VTRQITEAQIARARRRAFGATDWRSAPVAVDYTQFTDAELRAARDEVLETLAGEDANEDAATRADQISAEVERRNTVTEATNARRQRLANVTVVERWRPEQGNTTPPRGQQRQEERDDTPPEVPSDWRAQLIAGANSYRAGGMHGSAEVLHLPNATDLRTLVTTTTNPPQPARKPGILRPPDAPLMVADLVDQQTATSNVIEWVVETSFTNAAVEVAEGQPKPEAAIAFAVNSATLATIAHWVPLTRQAAEDDAQLVGYLQGRLTWGVEKRVDAQTLTGNGTAPNMRGILNTAGIQTQAVAPDGMLIAIRKAITKVQIAQYSPSGVVMHPIDWEGVELTRDTTTGTFLFTKDPASLQQPRVWGLPVVPTVTIAAGTALVGAFKEGATLWRKPGVRILMSDSHDVNFTKNILVLLAETRCQLAVYLPPAFVKVS
jgi:HK97 family phage major capsid protein